MVGITPKSCVTLFPLWSLKKNSGGVYYYKTTGADTIYYLARWFKYYLAGDSGYKIKDSGFEIQDWKRKVWKCISRKKYYVLEYQSMFPQ